MKRMSFVLLASFFATAPFAGAANAEVMQVRACGKLTDIPIELRQADEHESALHLTYFVTGNRMSDFKPGSLKVDSLTRLDGAPATDVKVEMDDSASRVSATGSSGRFRIRLLADNAAELARNVRLKGSVIVYGESKTAPTAPVAVPAEGEAKVGDSGYQVYSPVNDGDNIVVRVVGDASRLVDVNLRENGRMTRPLLFRRTETGADIVMRPKPGAKITVGLVLRVGERPESMVPFEFGA